MNTVPPSPFTHSVLIIFETAALTTTAMELCSVSTKEGSFKCHNIIRITARSRPSSPLRIGPNPLRRPQNVGQLCHDTTQALEKGKAALGRHYSRYFSYTHPPNSSLLFLLLSKVFSLYRGCAFVVGGRLEGQKLSVGLNARHSVMCSPLL